MRKRKLHTVTIIVGSMIAFAIAFSQFLAPEFCSTDRDIKTEQAANASGEKSESFISLPSLSLPAPVHVQANLTSYCLFEIFFEEDTDEVQTEDDLVDTDRFFQTLFRVIISPNAP